MQRSSSPNGRQELLELNRKASSHSNSARARNCLQSRKFHPSSNNQYPAPSSVYTRVSDLQLQGERGSNCFWFCHNYIFFLNKNWKTLAKCSLNMHPFHRHQAPCPNICVVGRQRFIHTMTTKKRRRYLKAPAFHLVLLHQSIWKERTK